MADWTEEIKALQLIVTELARNSFEHRIQGLVFGSKGLAALADKYAAHACTSSHIQLLVRYEQS